MKTKPNGQRQAKELEVYKVLGVAKAESLIRRDLVKNANTDYYTFKPEGAGHTLAYLYKHDHDAPMLSTATVVHTPTEDYVVADVRPYVNRDLKIKNLSDANILFANVAFEDIWASEGFGAIQSLAEYPTRVYIGMVSKLLNSVYRLENKDVNLIRIAAGLHAIFRTHGPLPKDQLATMIARYTTIPYDYTYKVLTGIIATHTKDIADVNVLAAVINEHGESMKLGKIKGSVILEQMYKIFYCTGHRYKLALGVEHFPVWMSLVYAAAEDKRYKRTLLSSYIASAPRSESDIKSDYLLRCKVLIEPYLMDDFF